MRCALWPNSDHDHRTEVAAYFERPSDVTVCLVAEAPDEGLVGFAEVGTRPYAEGCLTSPVGYLEGIFVRPLHRDSGVGRSLVETAEAWARELGCIEMASDRLLNNEPSGATHPLPRSRMERKFHPAFRFRSKRPAGASVRHAHTDETQSHSR
jgi:aminoglycoside 6'-N-acetyltransferase I